MCLLGSHFVLWPISKLISRLGDVIYGDSRLLLLYNYFNGLSHIQQKYNLSKNDPFYKDFEKKNHIIGVWDDHDYGANNGFYRYLIE